MSTSSARASGAPLVKVCGDGLEHFHHRSCSQCFIYSSRAYVHSYVPLIFLNREQRRPFVVRDQIQIISCVLHHELNGKNPSRYLRGSRLERDRPPGLPPLVTPQLNGGPARRAVNNFALPKRTVRKSIIRSTKFEK